VRGEGRALLGNRRPASVPGKTRLQVDRSSPRGRRSQARTRSPLSIEVVPRMSPCQLRDSGRKHNVCIGSHANPSFVLERGRTLLQHLRRIRVIFRKAVIRSRPFLPARNAQYTREGSCPLDESSVGDRQSVARDHDHRVRHRCQHRFLWNFMNYDETALFAIARKGLWSQPLAGFCPLKVLVRDALPFLPPVVKNGRIKIRAGGGVGIASVVTSSPRCRAPAIISINCGVCLSPCW